MRKSTEDFADLARRLHRHVDMFAGVIGERNVPNRYGALQASARYIEDTLKSFGYAPSAQEFPAYGKPVRNIQAEICGRKQPNRIWIIGAHYDSIDTAPPPMTTHPRSPASWKSHACLRARPIAIRFASSPS